MTDQGKIKGAPQGAPEFESYTQLLRALLPRMIGVSIFGAAGEVLWSNEMSVDESLGKLVSHAMGATAENPGAPGVLITDGEPLYIFWLLRASGPDQGKPFAAVLLRCRAGSEKEQRSLAFVYAMVRPALDILARELQSREQIVSLSGSLAEQDQDLEMLLAVSGVEAADEEGEGDELKAVLRAAIDHIQGGLAAIIVPEKNLVLVRQQPERIRAFLRAYIAAIPSYHWSEQ